MVCGAENVIIRVDENRINKQHVIYGSMEASVLAPSQKLAKERTPRFGGELRKSV
jgi:hypothetical protein